MISTNDFRAGLTIDLDGETVQVLESMHVKPGKGQAFVRTKLKNLRTGAIFDKTFNAGEKLPPAHVERRPMQYLYRSGEEFYLMDTETFEQLPVRQEQLAEKVDFLKENMVLEVLQHDGEILGVDLPNTVELEVVETDPGLKGDTATGGTKPARLETGATIRVPLFISVGERIKVDTRSREYISRV